MHRAFKNLFFSIFVNPELLCDAMLIPVMFVLAPVSSKFSLWCHTCMCDITLTFCYLWRYDSHTDAMTPPTSPRTFLDVLSKILRVFPPVSRRGPGLLRLSRNACRTWEEKEEEEEGRCWPGTKWRLFTFSYCLQYIPSPSLSPPLPLPHLRSEQYYFTPLWSSL